MAGIFDISMDKLDFNKIKMQSQSAANTAEAQASRETRTKTDLLQCVRKNTLIAFVQQCRMHNIDALHELSLQVVILLMSKCTNRMQLCKKFMSYIPNAQDRIEIDEGAATMVDNNELHALQSTSDWVTLFRHIQVTHMSEQQRTAIRDNPRMVVFCKAMRHIMPEHTDIEEYIRPMLCTVLMHIPAANMLERVLLADGPQHRDIELMCLRAVNSYVDECQHMSNDTIIDLLPLLMQSIRAAPSFHADLTSVVENAAPDNSERAHRTKHKFSLRRHLKDRQGATVLHRALLFEDWKFQMKFSVNHSVSTQQLLYFISAQPWHVDTACLGTIFDKHMITKTFALNLERIDADAVTAVIKTLRVYQYNIQNLIEFRTQCLVGFNLEVRKRLTLSVVLQLYVACWQHQSIREHCWRAIIPCYNFAITSRCDEFRLKYPYEQQSVIETLFYCHTEHRKAAFIGDDGSP